MRTRALLLLAGVVTAAMTAMPTSEVCATETCSCRPDSTLGRTVAEQTVTRRNAADAVVLATVIGEDTLANGGPVVARLRVTRVWKGAGTETLSVAIRSAPPQVSSCDVDLEVGRTYVVFAYEVGGYLWARYCSGTRRAEHSAEVLAALGEGRRPSP